MSSPACWDNVYEVHTPEGVTLRLQPASLLPRALAWAIDLALRLVAGLLLVVALGVLGDAGAGLIMVCLFVLMWAYPIVFEARWGATPGKYLLGLRVLAGNGAPLGWGAACVRNLLRVVDLLPLGYCAGALCSLFDPRSRRLGDLVADSLVVHRPQPATAPGASAVPAQPLPLALHADEQALLLAWAERSSQLGERRSEELARLVPALSAHGRQSPATTLHALANGLLGRP